MRFLETNDAIVRDAFEDVALLIGTVATVHRFEDAVVWTLLRRLDRLRLRTLARLPGANKPTVMGDMETEQPSKSHPAVEEFLIHNRGRAT
jgi:hypothetical protein